MIRSAFIMMLLIASTLLPGTATAAPSNAGLKRLVSLARGGGAIVIPAEWGGVWSAVDSTYDCAGVFDFTETAEDTICPGVPVMDPDENPIPVDCSGSADATSVNLNCTGTIELFPDCQLTFTSSLRGTRTGETYFIVSTTEVAYVGPAKGCDQLPGYCVQINSHGTRTAPTPVAYCQTPARPMSWGTLKLRYR